MTVGKQSQVQASSPIPTSTAINQGDVIGFVVHNPLTAVTHITVTVRCTVP